MALRGNYNPTGFSQSNPATWPTPAPYSPDDWWNINVAGTINGVAVEPGDRVYPAGEGRRIGDLEFGDEVFGGKIPDPPWAADSGRVVWRAYRLRDPAWHRPPLPGSGCPWGDDGWRFVLEVLTTSADARRFGDLTFGDQVFGDVNNVGDVWVDITTHAYGADLSYGVRNGTPIVDVSQALFSLSDPELSGALFPMRLDLEPFTVHAPIRASFLSPSAQPHVVFTGRVDRVIDDHDANGPRTITVEAFGMDSDLSVNASFQRPTETADERLRWLFRRARYAWGVGAIPTPGPPLRRLDRADDVNIREAADIAARSAGWMLFADQLGVLETLDWPLQQQGTQRIFASDCIGQSGYATPGVNIVYDTEELLNVVNVTAAGNDTTAPVSVVATDDISTSLYGAHSEVLGFPLEYNAQAAAVQPFADTVLARYGSTIRRMDGLKFDTTVDKRWFNAVVDAFDIGTRVTFTREGTRELNDPNPVRTEHFEGLLTGWQLSILPNRLNGTIYTTATDS